MQTAFHYVFRAKLVLPKKDDEIKFFEFEKKFENEDPVIARNFAFREYQNFIDVLLESKNKKYDSDLQARQDLSSFVDPGTKTKIKYGESYFELSESLGNGIGIFMVIDIPIQDTDDKAGVEFFIHGIGSIGLSYDPDIVMLHLSVEFNYYKHFGYDTQNKEFNIVYCNRGEWEDGYQDDEPSEYRILETPFNWDGYDQPYWWIDPSYKENEDNHKLTKAVGNLAIKQTVEEIIRGGESNTVEFKPTLLYNFKTRKAGIGIKAIIAKAICSFLNSNGGWLFIGIDDNGEIQGLDYDYKLAEEKKPKDFFLLEFDQMLEHFLTFSIKSNVVGQFCKINDKDVFWVTITANKRRPIFLKGQEGKEFYVRGEASSRQIRDVEEIVNYCIDRSQN